MLNFKRAILLFLSVQLLISKVLAQTPDSDQLLKKYTEIRENLVKDEEERRKVLSELYKVTRNMRKIQRKQEDLYADKIRLTENINLAGQKIEELKKQLLGGREIIAVRLRSLYKFGVHGSMRLLFASQSFVELDRNSKLLGLILNRDLKLMDAHRENIKKYGTQKVQMKQDMKRLARLEREIEEQTKVLTAQQEIKNEILKGFDDATVERLKNLEDLRSNSNLQARADLEVAFFERKGKLQSPVRGRLRQKYGTLKDSTSEARMRFKGNFFETDSTEPVYAVHSGEVSFVGPIQGYGSTVIIAHGDHYYSVYGGLSLLNAHEGDKVVAGDILGNSGKGFHLFSTGLYFEIRHFSDPVNPAEWLADGRRQISYVQDSDN